MIEINLLPEELRANLKKQNKSLNFSASKLLLVIPLLLGILIFAHIYLTIVSIAKYNHYNTMNKAWKKLEPQRKILEGLGNDNALLSETAKNIKKLADIRLIWAEKLNKLSAGLPSGIWFNEISLSNKELVVKASAVSLQNDAMSLIARLIDNLKKDAGFFNGFNSLELGPVQHRNIGSYDIADFTISGALKTK